MVRHGREAEGTFPCVTDATHLQGLAALRRCYPRSWHEVMRAAARPVSPTATVADAMATGGMGRLLPRAATAAEGRRLKRLRHCAARLVRAYGDVAVADIDEAWLRRERPGAGEAMEVGREVAGRAFTLLRQVVRGVQEAAGRPRVKRRLPPRRRRALDERPERRVAPWGTVSALVARGALWIRAAVALQAHLGVRPGLVLALRVQDIDLQACRVEVRVPGRRGPVRVPFALPRDAVAAVRPWWDRVSRRGPAALLFPQRGSRRRPRASINRALAREARRLRVPRTTMAQIRRLAQAGLRGVGAVRAQVRGSARRPSLGRGLTGGELSRQRWAWQWQLGAEERAVAVRAPRGCHADEPECRPREVPRRRRRRSGHGPTTLRRAVPWGAEARELAREVEGREAAAGTELVVPSTGGGPLPEFVGRRQEPATLVVRQVVPGPPRLDDLLGAGLVGASIGVVAALAAPEVAQRALELGSKALAVTALDVVGGRQG